MTITQSKGINKMGMLKMIEVLRDQLYAPILCWIREIPDHLKTQMMCGKAVRIESSSLAFVPDHLKTEGMCNEAVRRKPYTTTLYYVPDHLKMQKICNEVMRNNSIAFFFIPDRFKTKQMCIKALEVKPR